MQAITTKFLGPTDTKGARIKASTGEGSMTVAYEYDADNSEARHRRAAQLLAERRGWMVPGDGRRLVGGWLGKGEGWAFIVEERPLVVITVDGGVANAEVVRGYAELVEVDWDMLSGGNGEEQELAEAEARLDAIEAVDGLHLPGMADIVEQLRQTVLDRRETVEEAKA